MSSSKNESQTEESSSDEEQENGYDGIDKLMGNLAPYDYEPEWAFSSSTEVTESSENETSSNDATSENENDQLGWVGNKDWCINVVNAKGKYEKLTVYSALRYQLS